MTVELIANSPTPGSSTPIATLATAVITTPAAGTIETWTFSSAPPAALQAAGQYRFTIDSEICIDVTGGAGASRQIQRGAEGSSVATHLQGAGIYHGITAGGLANWLATNPGNLPSSVGYGTPPSPSWLLIAWAEAGAFQLASATRDANGAITTASVVWPDGATGTFTTVTASSSFPGAIDAYRVTYVYGAGPTTKTITQTAVTRDSNGAVTAQPALTVA